MGALGGGCARVGASDWGVGLSASCVMVGRVCGKE